MRFALTDNYGSRAQLARLFAVGLGAPAMGGCLGWWILAQGLDALGFNLRAAARAGLAVVGGLCVVPLAMGLQYLNKRIRSRRDACAPHGL